MARQVWRAFCRLGASFIACRRGRGISLINGREIVPVDETGKSHWRSIAVQIISEPEVYQGTVFKLRVDELIRVHNLLQICLGYRS